MALKGKIRGPSKTLLGDSLRGTAAKAIDSNREDRSFVGPKDLRGILTDVIFFESPDGDMTPTPFAIVKLFIKNDVVEHSRPLLITNSWAEIEERWGGIEGLVKTKPIVKVSFDSRLKLSGTVTLGLPSIDLEEYAGGQIKEYEGFFII